MRDQPLSRQRLDMDVTGGGYNTVTDLLLLNARAQVPNMYIGVLEMSQ